MANIVARPEGLRVDYYPGNPLTLTATFPAGYLSTRTLRAFLGGRESPGVELTCTEDTDELTVTMTEAQSLLFDGPTSFELYVYTAPSSYVAILSGTWFPGTDVPDSSQNIPLTFTIPSGEGELVFDGSVGLPGPQGEPGTDGADGLPGLDWQGEWDSGTTYAIRDGVSRNGNSYIAVAENTDDGPPSASWDLLAEKGADGAGSGNVSAVNAPSVGQYSRWVSATTIEGRTAAQVRSDLGLVIGTNVQAWSATLDATTAAFTSAKDTKLTGIEALADVTDATNVDAAGAVMESDYNANTILAATADNTPIPLTVGASTFLGRKASGDIAAMSVAEATALLVTTGSWTPTITAGSGTFTTTSASGDYIVIGSLVWFVISVAITTNGSAATSVIATLPFSAALSANAIGRENNLTGIGILGAIGATGSTITLRDMSNNYPGGSGRNISASGVYKKA